jgi:hypothetical protein
MKCDWARFVMNRSRSGLIVDTLFRQQALVSYTAAI